MLAQARAEHQAGRPAGAVALLDAELTDRPALPAQAALALQCGQWLQELGQPLRAGARLAQATRLAPTWAEAWHTLGLWQLRQGQLRAAADSLQRAVEHAPAHSAGWHAWGLALGRLGLAAQALGALDQALQRVLADRCASAAILADRAAVLSALGRLDEALDSACRAHQLDPGHAPAWNNEAAVRLRLQQPQAAWVAASRARQLAPADLAAGANQVRALHLLGRVDEALRQAQVLTQTHPEAATAWHLRLGLCNLAARWSEAAQAGEELLRLAPATPLAAGHVLHARAKLCRWDHWQERVDHHALAIAAGQAVALPFAVLALVDDGGLHRQATQHWLRHEVQAWPPAVAVVEAAAPPRLRTHSRRPGPWRIGWLSADFRAHAMARLLVGSFEAMDHDGFEHHALSISPVLPHDPMQQRLRVALPRWHELQALDDDRAAQAVAALQLDVLVDLGGPTRGARPGLLARRPAPWQVAYLGYMASGSGPAPQAVADAVVADETTVPLAHEADFSEQVLRMPTGLWPCESALAPGLSAALESLHAQEGMALARAQLRRAQGLPDTGFVFCNFCDAAKLNPPSFDVWMRLLRTLPGSVLWLRRSSDEMVANLQAEAERRGVQPQRLVWAERLPWQQHLARHPAADLFLDSWPFNGHTTVADALLAGLPVLTLQGRAMAARVAASQLRARGLHELVCTSVVAYEDQAMALARQPQKLHLLRHRLQHARPQHVGPQAVRRYTDELLNLLVEGRGPVTA